MSNPTSQATEQAAGTALAAAALADVDDPIEIATGGAVLMVDAATDRVVDANPVAGRMSGGTDLPASLDSWCAAAGLTTGVDEVSAAEAIRGTLDGGGGTALLSRRPGRPESLWAVGVPLEGAPDGLDDRVLVALLPGTGLRETATTASPLDGLQMRAAVASHLSFTISDPSQPDNPLIWVNPAFCEVTGYSTEEVLGYNCRFLQGEGTDPAAVQRIRAALAEGSTVGTTLLNYRKDGTPFWNQVVISPVLGEDGEVTHHVGIQTDVTDRVHADRRRASELDEAHREKDEAHREKNRLGLLAQITQSLVDLFDEEAGAAVLPELVAPHFGSWCAVVVVDERDRPRLVHVASRDLDRADDVALLEASQRWALESPAIHRVLSAEPSYVAEPFPVDVDSLPDRTDPRELAALERLGLGSAIVVPLRGRDHTIGVLVVISEDPPESFSADDVRDIVALGARGGLALDNARLYRREHHTALTLQHSMLPEIVEAPGLDCAALYEPASAGADVGGDWYDVVPLPSGRVAVSVGDVVGHDVRAAASMGQLRSVLRSEAWSGRSAAAVVSGMDELVRGLAMADMATCVFALIDPADDDGVRRVTYTRCGHPAPLLLRADGEVELLEEALTTPIGAPTVSPQVPEATTELRPGDLLVLFTDGLVERRDRSLRDQLANLHTCAAEMATGLDAAAARDTIVEACADGEREDDTCILVVRNASAPTDESET
ncbi:SpoIIE family protein phosphatase [Isoptericola chiayiensis]|uniref:SpoIIE family protein phosphatase n=1 Tax=Isoptericola chiayiensis TaxID=579446 RepID=A0ABP8YHB6_9MICO|nr:SpoIIE family protein phosphatase [Isoptericola chiayiensis]NOW00474.1 PAS domain S-box-containing protein [Isoptericola chiayiensis]